MKLNDKYVCFAQTNCAKDVIAIYSVAQIIAYAEMDARRAGIFFRTIDTFGRLTKELKLSKNDIKKYKNVWQNKMFAGAIHQNGLREFRPATDEEVADPILATIEHMVQWMTADGKEFLMVPASDRERIKEELKARPSLNKRDVKYVLNII
jgi:hypothetical protein